MKPQRKKNNKWKELKMREQIILECSEIGRYQYSIILENFDLNDAIFDIQRLIWEKWC